MTPADRVFAIAGVIVACALSNRAQISCGAPDSIAVSIAPSLYTDQMPVIVVSARNVSGHTMKCEAMESVVDSANIHIEGTQGVPPKSMWYRRRTHEYSYPELMTTLNVGCEASLATTQFAPGETASLKYVLEAMYFINKPGEYSVYSDVGDPLDNCESKPKWLRTNTVQLEITPEQVAVWEAKAGTPHVHATISMKETQISLQQAPTVEIVLQNDNGTSYDGDDFFPRVERDGVEMAKTTYFRERLHEPGTRQYELFEGPKPDFPDTSRKSYSIEAHQSSAWEIDLRNFYKLDAPGKYSVYVEFPDFSGKPLRSNTIEFVISPPN